MSYFTIYIHGRNIYTVKYTIEFQITNDKISLVFKKKKTLSGLCVNSSISATYCHCFDSWVRFNRWNCTYKKPNM